MRSDLLSGTGAVGGGGGGRGGGGGGGGGGTGGRWLDGCGSVGGSTARDSPRVVSTQAGTFVNV